MLSLKQFFCLIIIFSTAFITAPALAQNSTDLNADIHALTRDWAVVKYETSGKDAQIRGYEQLAERASALMEKHPNAVEPKIWRATILSSQASVIGGVSALPHVKEARRLLESSIAQDPTALDGMAYTILGALYNRVPGWPIAFGNKGKAGELLAEALEINDQNIDANFYYADYLKDQGNTQDAARFYQRVIDLPSRADFPVYDHGRKAEARAALDQL